jgi:hypothetical protein
MNILQILFNFAFVWNFSKTIYGWLKPMLVGSWLYAGVGTSQRSSYGGSKPKISHFMETIITIGPNRHI